MKLFFSKKPKIMIEPNEGKQIITYNEIYTNAILPFSHICNLYSRVRDLDFWRRGLIINGEDYSFQSGFDINNVIFNMYDQYNVKKIRLLNSVLDIRIDCNKVNSYEVITFIKVLKTDEKSDVLEIIFNNDEIDIEFYFTF